MARDYFQFSLRSLVIGVTVLAALFGGGIWYYRNFVEPWEHDAAIRRDILALATRRPANLTARQWESAVAWTINLHGNSLLFYQTDLPTKRHFRQQLERKLAEDVDLQTIYWIWDEYAKACRGGKEYQRFREVMQEEIDAGGGYWNLNVK